MENLEVVKINPTPPQPPMPGKVMEFGKIKMRKSRNHLFQIMELKISSIHFEKYQRHIVLHFLKHHVPNFVAPNAC